MAIFDPARFWSKVEKTDSCWVWQGATNNMGYGQFHYEGKTHLAHRIAWLIENKQFTEGLILDHKCGNPLCMRVSHLHEVTQAMNIRLGKGSFSNGPRYFCKHGHALTPDNLINYTTQNKRTCKTCQRNWARTKLEKQLANSLLEVEVM